MEQKTHAEIILDFGEEFGQLTKHDVGALFVDLHASISPLNPLAKAAAC